MIILQTLPSVGLGLYTRWFHRGALIAGWASGLAFGMWMLYEVSSPTKAHFAGSAFPLSKFGFDTDMPLYAGLIAVTLNLVVAAVVTLVLRALKTPDGVDSTVHDDYFADEGDEKVEAGTEPSPVVST